MAHRLAIFLQIGGAGKQGIELVENHMDLSGGILYHIAE